MKMQWVVVVAALFAFAPFGCGRADVSDQNELGTIEPLDGGVPEPCGNLKCEPGETPYNCAEDCRCGDGVCSDGESCAQDCTSKCGNGVCDSDETPQSCPRDCRVVGPRCGNGVCDSG